MIVLKFHGTPITPRSVLHHLAGRNFCVSFARPDDVEVCHAIGQSVMLDNGAFTAWRNGKAVTNWGPYYDWCAGWLEHWSSWAVIPDVMGGSEDENDELLGAWPFGDRGAPVYHLHESLDRLDRLVESWPLVCLGSTGPYSKLKSVAWWRRMSEAMDVACDRHGVPRTRLHLLRGLDFADGPFPLYSADSSNVAQNHARRRTRPVHAVSLLDADALQRLDERAYALTRKVIAIDARRPAVRWRGAAVAGLDLPPTNGGRR